MIALHTHVTVRCLLVQRPNVPVSGTPKHFGDLAFLYVRHRSKQRKY